MNLNTKINYHQKILLKAALLVDKKCLDCWHQWKANVDIEKLDSESFHLLPLLYRNLSSYKLKNGRMQIVKGVYRRNWCANQLLIQKSQTIIDKFQEAKIENIVLGDVTLATNYYKDWGDRPIYSLNFLMHTFDIERVKKLLADLNYSLQNALPDRLYFQGQNEGDRPIVIHTILFRAEPQEHTNKQLWHYANPAKLGNISIQVLSHTDQLLYVCSQGFIKHQFQHLRTIADAMTILQSSASDIDWIRLVTQAQRYELILPLKNMLNLLKEIFEIQIPEWILPSLSKMAVSHFELLEYQVFDDNTMLAIKSFLLRSIKPLIG